MPLEGVIIAADRVVLNSSSVLLIAAIPRERFGDTDRIFIYGIAVMIVGCTSTVITRHRFSDWKLIYDRLRGGAKQTRCQRGTN